MTEWVMGFGQYLFISAADGNSPSHTDHTMRSAESRAVDSHVEKSCNCKICVQKWPLLIVH